jgi:hypothetical protein
MNKEKIKKTVETEFSEFANMVAGMPLSELEKNIALYAKQREEVQLAQADDDGIKALKDQIKEAKAPYNDALKALKLKLGYLYLLIQERKPTE